MKFRLVWPHLAALLILLVCCNNYYGDVLTMLPFGTHEWAQADRYALAINFYDNGLDFFHPATQNLASEHGIAGVEFPVQAYLSALIARLTGRGSISLVFRLLDIAIAITGLYFLFRAVYNATRDFIFSLVTPLFIFCSPVFIFYAGNYLPDPAAASISFIALYFLLEAMRLEKQRQLLTAIAFATLATLMKTSACTYLGGIICFGLYDAGIRAKDRRNFFYILAATCISGALIAGNLINIRYLNQKYHSSLFLSSFRPFDSWEEFVHYINNQYKNHMVREYITVAQYPLFVMILGMGGAAFAGQKPMRSYMLPLIFFLPVAITIFYLFSKQYEIHDYYFICTFLPLVAYCLSISLIAIRSTLHKGQWLSSMRTGLLCAAIVAFFFADYQNSLRVHMDMNYADNYSFRWSEGGAALLNRLGIPANEPIVVANETPPNLALTYFDRKGYHISADSWGRDAGQLKLFAEERGVRVAVMRQNIYDELRAKDSATIATCFDLLALESGKVVLRRK